MEVFHHCAVQIYSKRKEEYTMKPIEVQHKLTYWQRVFIQSKVNGASYHGESLSGQVWCWPKNTYLQRRLHLRQNLTDNGPPITQRNS